MKRLSPLIVDNHTLFSVIALVIFFIAFITYKISHIDVPYFWDESWVYGPAISAMGERFPSLLAGSIDINLSRGHPMLFHFIGGIWGNIFGNSIVSLHAFALSISVVLLGSFYHITKQLFSQRIASLTTILLLVQGVFLAQSAMVLPEILVALLALWSIFHFSQERYFIASLFAALCLMTKESGAILMPALGISFLLHQVLLKNFTWKKSLRILGYLIIACLPYLLFLWLQHRSFGWYFFPNHVDLQVENADKWQQQFLDATRYVLESQGRIAITLMIFVVILYSLRQQLKIIVWLIFLAIGGALMMLVPMNSFIMFIGFIVLLLGIFSGGIYILGFYENRYFILLIAGIFSFLFLLFTGYNFFSARYILVLIPLFLLAYAQMLKIVGRNWWIEIYTISAALFCLFQTFQASSTHDTNQNFIKVSYLHKDLIKHVEDLNVYDNPIFAPFLTMEALHKFHAGYRSTQDSFTNVNRIVPPNEKLYVISSSFEGTYFIPGHMEKRMLLDSVKFVQDEHWFKLEIYDKELQ